MDVDQLKAVNDRWGHPAGDQMLVRVAGAIRDSLRGCDTASRYGGDEFAVILPDTDVRAARFVAERICDKVGASDAPIKVTVSGGLADLSLAASSPSEARLIAARSEEHTSELQSLAYLVCRLLLEKKKI